MAFKKNQEERFLAVDYASRHLDVRGDWVCSNLFVRYPRNQRSNDARKEILHKTKALNSILDTVKKAIEKALIFSQYVVIVSFAQVVRYMNTKTNDHN